MTKHQSSPSLAAVTAATSGLVMAMLLLVLFPTSAQRLVNLTEDGVLVLAAWIGPPAVVPRPVAVIEIDAASLGTVGPWPWRRERIAALVTAAQEAGAAAVAIDILFAEPDANSPTAMARRLATLTGAPVPEDLGPDDDMLLGQALATVPTALGFALSPVPNDPPRGAPVLRVGTGALAGLWTFAGVEPPVFMLSNEASGLGALAVPGDPDGAVRRVPLFVSAAGEIRPGLALEAVRLAEGARHFKVDSQRGQFAAGTVLGQMTGDGMLRILPIGSMPPLPHVSAVALLEGNTPAGAFSGAVVFIGGSAPQLGGLRQVPGGKLVPTVDLHAMAAAQILSGRTPVALPNQYGQPWTAAVAGTALGTLAILLPPLGAATLAATISFVLLGGALFAAMMGLLIDPVVPILTLGAAYAAGMSHAFASQYKRAARLRLRFAQRLAPAVIEMLIRDPAQAKLAGSRREVTALFTDVEGFTAMTRRCEPEQLIALLDTYFDGMARIVTDHGGMVDKFVGDAVHAFFNAPLDLPDHAETAVRCAVDLLQWSEAFRTGDAARAAGFGRTRIGIETGPAVVGDVGTNARLDYTAHGDAVNAAARLEAANKELGTAICIGPGTAVQCRDGLLHPVGRIALRGISDSVEVFTVCAGTTKEKYLPVTEGTPAAPNSV